MAGPTVTASFVALLGVALFSGCAQEAAPNDGPKPTRQSLEPKAARAPDPRDPAVKPVAESNFSRAGSLLGGTPAVNGACGSVSEGIDRAEIAWEIQRPSNVQADARLGTIKVLTQSNITGAGVVARTWELRAPNGTLLISNSMTIGSGSGASHFANGGSIDGALELGSYKIIYRLCAATPSGYWIRATAGFFG